MDERDEPPGGRWYSEEDATRILDRVIRLDAARQGGRSEAQIREIARELGIADELVTSAIAQVQAAQLSPMKVRPPLGSLGYQAGLFAGVGGAIAVALTPIMSWGVAEYVVLPILIAMPVVLAFDSRHPSPMLRLCARTIGMWVGLFGVGNLVEAVGNSPDFAALVAVPLVGGFALVLARTARLRTKGDGDPPGNDRGSSTPWPAKVTAWYRRCVAAVREEFMRRLRAGMASAAPERVREARASGS